MQVLFVWYPYCKNTSEHKIKFKYYRKHEKVRKRNMILSMERNSLRYDYLYT